MRTNKTIPVHFEVLKNSVKFPVPKGHLCVTTGETEYREIQVFKKYVNSKLKLKFCVLKDKATGDIKIKFRPIKKRRIFTLWRRLLKHVL